MRKSRKQTAPAGTRGPLPEALCPGDEWMSENQAAIALGKTRHTLRKRALRGEIAHQSFAGRLFYLRESVETARKRDDRAARAA